MARRSIRGCRGILTGASSGIGRALAGELVRDGARLVLVARRGAELRQLARDLKDAPGEVAIVEGDVTDPAIRAAAATRASENFGGLDLLVNNAGVGAMGRFDEATPERLRRVMEVNFFAAAELIRLAVPLLARGQHPLVVNVSSVLGHRGVPRYAEYCASKFALAGLSESLRTEFTVRGIDLLVVSPGRTKTEFFDSAIDNDGTPWPQIKGAPAEQVARTIVRAMRKGKREVVISTGGKLLVWAGRLVPGLLDRVLARDA